MAKNKLTPKQAKFVKEYKANGGNGTQAAIKAGYSKKTAYSIGEENLRKPEIKAALGIEEEKMQKKYDYTIDKLVDDIEVGLKMAKEQNNTSAYFKGVELMGKAFGLFVDKVKNEISLTQALVVFDKAEAEDETGNGEDSGQIPSVAN